MSNKNNGGFKTEKLKLVLLLNNTVFYRRCLQSNRCGGKKLLLLIFQPFLIIKLNYIYTNFFRTVISNHNSSNESHLRLLKFSNKFVRHHTQQPCNYKCSFADITTKICRKDKNKTPIQTLRE